MVPISARSVTLNTGPKPGRWSKTCAIGSVAAIVRIAADTGTSCARTSVKTCRSPRNSPPAQPPAQRLEPPRPPAVNSARGARHALPQQQRMEALLETRLQARQLTAIPAQFAQIANRRRRIVNPHDTVAPQRVGQPPRIEAVGLGRVARFDSRLARIDHVHRPDVIDDPIDKRPRRTRGFDRDVAVRPTARQQGGDAAVASSAIAAPTVRSAVGLIAHT